ncbi:Rrn11p NDAI_0D00890 [Naumovozyma dairenensis CBS 421]|uniref:RNA polymerase I-specific transcription initiation factor RRN11 n=1 Tax=Naumovozyma dairenensis (strain ATCC 10597 / BCRC 20456 / CBS 421 / NBRC 0211 / NRRL Y-12639) TaxID=1071378 RepID=G0W9E2_NAUDC|nr:hypothetical protein NDAI_0D00890 [Naumovozyma dairenensis CBS 421]CCD24403.1 hypothetical protein NDAI_0D00890 [Naumovozyma dairenensis CBS 421]
MFELPIIYNNKRTATERKIRYTYINQLSKKYNRTQNRHNNNNNNNGILPTPESSATESHDDDDATTSDDLIKRKRLRRRWKSVIGEAYSDTDLDDDDDDEEEEEDVDVEDEMSDHHESAHHIHENEERKFFKKYEKPQETFEIWQTNNLKRVPINKSMITYTKLKKIEKQAKRKITVPLLHASKINKLCFEAMSEGLELVTPLVTIENFSLQHIEKLTTLLYLNVSRENWDIAYRIFTLLIRIKKLDIRSIWGIGVRILSEKSPTKTLDFLNWMNSVYSSRLNFIQGINYRMDPVFKSGSRTHTPKYTLTWLWKSLIQYSTKKIISGNNNSNESLEDGSSSELDIDINIDRNNLLDLIEKISEMVLIPPFMEDSEVWFIYSLCHMVLADDLSSKFNPLISNGSRGDIERNQVIQHIQKTKSYLQTSMNKGDFEYPEKYILKQLSIYEQRLYASDPTSNNNNVTDEDVDMQLQDIPNPYSNNTNNATTNINNSIAEDYIFSDFSFDKDLEDLDTQDPKIYGREEDEEHYENNLVQSDSSE